jgi:hypothetical protein
MTRAVEASGRLIALVRANDDIANHGDGCDSQMMVAAEHDLGVTFPPSYRRLIEEFGTWDVAGEEFLGVYRTPAMAAGLWGSVRETRVARDRYGMPSELIAAMFDGMGGIVVLDASRPDSDGEYPVLVWNPGTVDRLGDDFGSYALGLCERAV